MYLLQDRVTLECTMAQCRGQDEPRMLKTEQKKTQEKKDSSH